MPTAVSKRLNGTVLSLTIAGTEYQADLTNYVLTWDDADSGTITFADAAAGGKFTATLKGSAVQSTTATSLWTYAWLNTGVTAAFKLTPNGNTTASTDQPIFTGNVKIGKRPDLGGDAQISGDDWTFDFEWTVIGDVTRAVS